MAHMKKELGHLFQYKSKMVNITQMSSKIKLKKSYLLESNIVYFCNSKTYSWRKWSKNSKNKKFKGLFGLNTFKK